jgi:hypothetical protein
MKAGLKASPYPAAGLELDFSCPGFDVISDIFDDAKATGLSQGLALFINYDDPTDLVGFRAFGARHGSLIGSLSLLLVPRHLARRDLLDVMSIVRDSMPDLTHLRLQVEMSEQDEVDCLQHLDCDTGTSRLRQLDMTGSWFPLRPMFNIMRLFAGLMDPNGTIEGIESQAIQYWQYIAKSVYSLSA